MANKVYTEMDDKLRYGISALSTEYRDVSEPDELMVRTRDGKIFYKRADGQIVTEVQDYGKNEILSDVVRTGADLTHPDNSYIAYHILDITGKTSMSSADKVDVGLSETEFDVPTGVSGLFIRIRGNKLTNGAVSFIRAIYEARYPDDAKTTPEVSIGLKVKVESTGVESDVSIHCNFDELSYVKIDMEEAYTVRIVSIQYPKLYNALKILTNEELNALNSMVMNTKFEGAVIDLVRFVMDVSKSPIYKNDGQIALGFILPYKDLETEMQATNIEHIFTVSEEQPDYPCLWAKVVTI